MTTKKEMLDAIAIVSKRFAMVAIGENGGNPLTANTKEKKEEYRTKIRAFKDMFEILYPSKTAYMPYAGLHHAIEALTTEWDEAPVSEMKSIKGTKFEILSPMSANPDFPIRVYKVTNNIGHCFYYRLETNAVKRFKYEAQKAEGLDVEPINLFE